MTSGAFSHTLMGHQDEVHSIRWSPKNEFVLATGSKDQTIRFWDIRRAGSLLVLDQHNIVDPFINSKYLSVKDSIRTQALTSHIGVVTHLEFTSSGDQLVSSGTDKSLRLWEVETGKNSLVHFPDTKNGSTMCKFAVTRGDAYVVYPNGSSLTVYEASSGKIVKQLPGHYSNIQCVTAHPTQMEFYSGGRDTCIFAWQPPIPYTPLDITEDVDADEDDWSDDEGSSSNAAQVL
jgi:DNA excision repair protein ERCC-8